MGCRLLATGARPAAADGAFPADAVSVVEAGLADQAGEAGVAAAVDVGLVAVVRAIAAGRHIADLAASAGAGHAMVVLAGAGHAVGVVEALRADGAGRAGVAAAIDVGLEAVHRAVVASRLIALLAARLDG